jgi:putative phosphoesterase
MKLLIASDLHGSAYFTRVLLERYREEAPEKLILLGDLLYHGPRNDLPREYAPKEVIALLNPLAPKILAVRGNCEAEVDQMVLSFPVMADYAVLFLGGKTVYLTHGHTVNKEHPLPFAKGDILLHGHTHIPACEDCGDFWYLNPGSVSIPKDGAEHGYMIWQDGEFLWKTLGDGHIYRRFRP